MAACQPTHAQLTHRYRGQAPSHTDLTINNNQFDLQTQSTVGGGLLPMAACQPTHAKLNHRYRGQAPSHIAFTST